MKSNLGNRIRELRTKQNLLLRHIASKLDVDSSIISKMERGERPIRKEQVAIFAKILDTDKDELQKLWLTDQLLGILENEPLGREALKIVTAKIK